MKSVLFKHRSIRKFRPTPIPEEVLRECLEAASRASTCGNMQLYSLVVTRDETLRERLAPCHFNQPMVRQAPCVVTVCADIHRFTMWCEQRDADPAYDNFAWFLNASTDALLAAQNLCVEAEMHGLGICYLGTTIYTAGDISQILELPKGGRNSKAEDQHDHRNGDHGGQGFPELFPEDGFIPPQSFLPLLSSLPRQSHHLSKIHTIYIDMIIIT